MPSCRFTHPLSSKPLGHTSNLSALISKNCTMGYHLNGYVELTNFSYNWSTIGELNFDLSNEKTCEIRTTSSILMNKKPSFMCFSLNINYFKYTKNVGLKLAPLIRTI
jgi:hypothetical protein